MRIIYYDTGTTNTRAYLIEDDRLVDRVKKHVGARNTAINNSAKELKTAIHDLYNQLLESNNLTPADVDRIYMSGMASSPDGIHEIAHLELPVTLDELQNAIEPYDDSNILPQTIWMIPGVRTKLPHGVPALPEEAVNLQMIRGEETEIAGLMRELNPTIPTLIVLPGSHTQIVLVERNRIVDFFSGITGEIRSALLEDSILQSSMEKDGPDSLDIEYVRLGYQSLQESGLNHAFYGVRTLDMFATTTDRQRQSYFQGVLTGGMIKGMLHRSRQRQWRPEKMVISGRLSEYATYKALMAIEYPSMPVESYLCDAYPLSVKGCISLMKDAPITI